MDGYGKRILVVDEDAGRRACLEVQLEQEGYAVQMASDGVAGADEMRKRHFKAVIADSQMLGLRGIEFAEFCRAAWPDTPVILLSSGRNYGPGNVGEVDAIDTVDKLYEPAMLLNVLRTATQTGSIEQSIFPNAQTGS
jgi:DNA-binding response OmpR family regulator